MKAPRVKSAKERASNLAYFKARYPYMVYYSGFKCEGDCPFSFAGMIWQEIETVIAEGGIKARDFRYLKGAALAFEEMGREYWKSEGYPEGYKPKPITADQWIRLPKEQHALEIEPIEDALFKTELRSFWPRYSGEVLLTENTPA